MYHYYTAFSSHIYNQYCGFRCLLSSHNFFFKTLWFVEKIEIWKLFFWISQLPIHWKVLIQIEIYKSGKMSLSRSVDILKVLLHFMISLLQEQKNAEKQMWFNTSNRTSCFRRSKLILCYFINGCSFSSILVQKFLKSGHCVLEIKLCQFHLWFRNSSDWWKLDFEKKALKICESVQSIGNSKVNFYMKTLFLHQVLQVALKN